MSENSPSQRSGNLTPLERNAVLKEAAGRYMRREITSEELARIEEQYPPIHINPLQIISWENKWLHQALIKLLGEDKGDSAQGDSAQ